MDMTPATALALQLTLARTIIVVTYVYYQRQRHLPIVAFIQYKDDYFFRFNPPLNGHHLAAFINLERLQRTIHVTVTS